MADKRVLIYKLDDSYLAFPPVLLDKGGNNIDFFNSTDDAVKLTLPDGAVSSKDDLSRKIAAGETRKIKTKSKGDSKFRAYQYTLERATLKNLKLKKLKQHLSGGSDPILILEN
jgi:hypothetical protein